MPRAHVANVRCRGSSGAACDRWGGCQRGRTSRRIVDGGSSWCWTPPLGDEVGRRGVVVAGVSRKNFEAPHEKRFIGYEFESATAETFAKS